MRQRDEEMSEEETETGGEAKRGKGARRAGREDRWSGTGEVAVSDLSTASRRESERRQPASQPTRAMAL